jgi:hypothetical protein
MSLREDALFSPHDPRLIYVNMLPRRIWSDLAGGRSESEGGFVLIDRENQQILFEGDRYRYIIPAASMLSCEMEEITKTQKTDGFYAAVLVVRTKTGTHEFPFAPLEGVPGANRPEKAEAMCKLLLAEFGVAMEANQENNSIAQR